MASERSGTLRVEDEATGTIKLPALHTEIPAERQAQAKAVADTLDAELFARFPWVEGSRPVSGDHAELVLNRTWRPALSLTGVEGMPSLASVRAPR